MGVKRLSIASLQCSPRDTRARYLARRHPDAEALRRQSARTKRYARRRACGGLAAVVLSAGLFPPGANAQMTPPQARPQAQSPTTQAPRSQSPSPTLSDEKLNAAAAAIGQVTSIRQNYERKISKAPPRTNDVWPRRRTTRCKRRLPIRASPSMNTIALSASPNMILRCAKSSLSASLIQASREV